jgi:hypothetical protein
VDKNFNCLCYKSRIKKGVQQFHCRLEIYLLYLPIRVNVSAMETVANLLHSFILIRCVLVDKKFLAEKTEKAASDNSAKRVLILIQ